MAPELKAAGADVTFLFSGRDPSKLFDMEPFGDYEVRKGLTFVTKNGKVDNLRTVFNNKVHSFVHDVLTLICPTCADGVQ